MFLLDLLNRVFDAQFRDASDGEPWVPIGCIPDPLDEIMREVEGEFGYGSFCLSWINVIQRDFADGAYNGKTVTPQDASKVLARWRLDDGDYRVIFGDLSSATVSPSRLRQLESR